MASDINIQEQESFSLSAVKAIVDYDDGVLFGTDGGGMVKLKDGIFIHYTPKIAILAAMQFILYL